MTDTTEDFLAHFGIKGMKWGVRHEPGSNGRVKSGRSTIASRWKTLTPREKFAVGVAGVAAAATIAIGVTATVRALKTGGKVPSRLFSSGASMFDLSKAKRSVVPLNPNSPLEKYIRENPKRVGDVVIRYKNGEKIVRDILGGSGGKTVSNKPILPSSFDAAKNASDIIKKWNDPNHKWEL